MRGDVSVVCMMPADANGSSKDLLVKSNGLSFYRSGGRHLRLFKCARQRVKSWLCNAFTRQLTQNFKSNGFFKPRQLLAFFFYGIKCIAISSYRRQFSCLKGDFTLSSLELGREESN